MVKSTKFKTFFIWAITVIITIGSILYQRKTGPTYPVKGKVEISGRILVYELLRSHDTNSDAKMEIANVDTSISTIFKWRRYKSSDNWKIDTLQVEKNKIMLMIPKQPAAGKVIYQLTLIDKQGTKYQLTKQPVVIRFKAPVPAYILAPHIFFMFFAMLLGTRTGIEAITKRERTYRFAFVTAISLCLGGLILGPIET